MAVNPIITLVLTSALTVLLWIHPTKGSRLSISCSVDNCTSSQNTYCDNGMCACLHGYQNKGNSCQLRKIGEPCSDHTDCIGISDSQCVNSSCKCNHGYTQSNESKVCIQRKLSDKCNTNSDCSIAIANSRCEKGECRCQDGYTQTGTLCLARQLGDNCSKAMDCVAVMNNTRCLKNKCACANLYMNEDNVTCRLRRLGDACTKNVECNHVQQEVRVCTKICSCSKGYKQINASVGDSFCLKFKLGDVCSKPGDCSSIAYGVCSQKKRCVCGSGSKLSVDKKTCDGIQLNDKCSDSKDCQNVTNSDCLGGKCLCVSGHREQIMEAGNTSFCQAKQIGDFCQSNDDCKVENSFCKNNMCSCKKGFSFLNATGLCTEKSVQETECSSTDDCLQHFENTVCDDFGFCTCGMKYYLHQNGFKCVFRYLGDSCSVSSECSRSVMDAECVNNVCQCGDRYLARNDNVYCALKRLGGWPCRNDDDCQSLVANSICDSNRNSTCFCNIGYYGDDKFETCLEKHLLDECVSDEDCSRTNPHAVCSPTTQRCECGPGFATQFIGTSHHSLSGAGYPKPACSQRRIASQLCSTSDDCSQAISNSSCGSCLEAPEDALCYKVCSTDALLREGGTPTNHTDDCSLRTCLCNKGFVSRDGGSRCEGRKLREPCRFDDDCSSSMAHAVCLPGLNVCYCASGFKEEGPEVCSRRVVGDRCVVDSDCEDAVTSTHCQISTPSSQRSGICRCISGYHGNNGSADCRKRHIGDQTCAVDSDCSGAVNSSYCHLGMCVCLQGYYRNFDHTQCYPRRLHLDYCDTDLDCSPVINNSVCKNYRCVCYSGFFEDSDQLCIKRNINDVCTFDKDCSDAVNNSACVGGICKCVSGFTSVTNDTCTRRKIYESSCESHLDCHDAVAGSGCYDGVCQCNPGHYSSSNKTVCMKRQLEDRCNTTDDCASVIANSRCLSNRCSCVVGFDGYDNNKRCVKAPVRLGQRCYFSDQCRKIDPSSNCSFNEHAFGVCVCPPLTFLAQNHSVCIDYPAAVGDFCLWDSHCAHNLPNSTCEANSCNCSLGYFEHTNKTSCHKLPQKLGDFCQEDAHCLTALNATACERNNTCVCDNGYTQISALDCAPRPLLPQFPHISHGPPPVCQAKCHNWTNSICVLEPGLMDGQCRCDFRHARRYPSLECVSVQTYLLHLVIAKEANKWDYRPLRFKSFLLSPRIPSFQRFADKITLNGLMVMFDNATSHPMKDRYVASEVTQFEPNKQFGVRATIVLHLTANYFDAVPLSHISSFINESLNSSDGLLGKSSLKVATPISEAFELEDYDECAARETNDCSKNAMCINTLGSFMCVCRSTYDDTSQARNLRPGRECTIRLPNDDSSDLCSTPDCQNKWYFVGMAVALFLLIVVAFITYEIIQRKQTFTARKLYEKFGTTQIRKLRHASMKRLKERKKRKKEENRKKKEEDKQKKEELKREKSDKRKKKEENKSDKKTQRDLEKGKKKDNSTDNDIEQLDVGQDVEASSPGDMMQSLSTPYLSSTDDSHNVDIASLPGSVNMSDAEMGYSRRAVSPIEESPV